MRGTAAGSDARDALSGSRIGTGSQGGLLSPKGTAANHPGLMKLKDELRVTDDRQVEQDDEDDDIERGPSHTLAR